MNSSRQLNGTIFGNNKRMCKQNRRQGSDTYGLWLLGLSYCLRTFPRRQSQPGNVKTQTRKRRPHALKQEIKNEQVPRPPFNNRSARARRGGRDSAPNKHGFPVTSGLLSVIWLRGFSRFYTLICLANAWTSSSGEGGLGRM